MAQPSNRLSNNSLSRAPPIASVKREQVALDPLLDNPLMSTPQRNSETGFTDPLSQAPSQFSTPPPSQGGFERNSLVESNNTTPYNNTPPPYPRPSSVQSTTDLTDVLAEQILTNCR
jgi:hypothetical protein